MFMETKSEVSPHFFGRFTLILYELDKFNFFLNQRKNKEREVKPFGYG